MIETGVTVRKYNIYVGVLHIHRHQTDKLVVFTNSCNIFCYMHHYVKCHVFGNVKTLRPSGLPS